MTTAVNTQNPADTQAQERLALWLIAAQSFFIAPVGTLTKIVADTVFLSYFGAELLPVTYIVMGIVVVLLSSSIIIVQRRYSFAAIAITTFVVLTIVYTAAWLILRSPNGQWVSFVLVLMEPINVLLALSIMVGGQAGKIFNVRQMKRLFPIVTGASFAGSTAIAFLAPWLPGGSQNLLLWVAGLVVVTLIFLLVMRQRFRSALVQKQTTSSSSAPSKPIKEILRSRYTLNLTSYQMLSAVGTQLVVYIFMALAAVQFEGNEEGLLSFLGIFLGVKNGVGFIVQMSLAGYLLTKFGLRLGLMLNPVVIGLAAVALALWALGFGAAGTVLFAMAVGAQFLDFLLSYAITGTSIKAAYQALPVDERTVVEATVEGIGFPMAISLTGVFLIIVNALPWLSLTHIMWFTVLVCILWTWSAWQAYGNYKGALLKTLRRRVLGEAELTLNDASSLATVEALVESKQLSSVRLGLDMLTDAEHPTLNEHLIRLLASDSSEIQREALGRIEKNPFSAALQPVQTLMESEDDAQVIGACIRTLCALDDDDLLNRVTPYLSDNLSETTIGAIVGLLRYGGISGVLAAGEHLTALEKSAEPTERQIVARIIGEVGVDNFYRPLIPLLQDENTAVRRAALISSSQVHHPRLLPYVIDNLANPLTRSAAMSALTATGQNLLPIIADALVDNLAHDEEDIIRMVRVCGQMKGQQVVNTLKPHIDHPDNDVQLAILQALQLADYHATNEEEIAEINKTMRGEVAHALRVLLAKQDLGEDAVYEAVHRSLDHEYEEARQRTFLLLCFIYDTRAILQAEERLMHGSRASQALALETLDVTLTSEQKQMVFPLVDSQMTTEQKIQQLQSVFDLQPLSLIERLTEIIRDPEQEWTNGWTRASVLYTVGKLKFLDLIDVVEEALVIEEHPIRETAVWALNALDPQRAQPHLTELCRDSNPSVGQLAAELLSNSTF